MKYSGCPTFPQQKITVTHSGTDYTFDKETLGVAVTLRENAASSCQFVANDYKSKTFLGRCDVGDNVEVELRYKEWPGHAASSWTQVFGGWVSKLEPSLSVESGEVVGITALGYGVALTGMLVRQQYGSQSEHASLNTIKECLTDATYGVVPKYVNKVMASATDSGYSIDTTKVADLSSDFRYLYFPGKPAIKCVEDMIDLVRAANTPNAGAHWTVIPSGTTARLCLATVGAHENPPADVWPTWWNTDQAGSTIEIKQDMIVSLFRKRRSEANYILYSGNFRRPASGDNWTESHTGWGTEIDVAVSTESSNYKVGSHCVKGSIATAAHYGGMFYPSSYDLNLDVDKIGTKKIIPRIGFYVYAHDITSNPAETFIELGKGDPANNDFYYHYFRSEIPDLDRWVHLSFPIGQYYDLTETTEFEWKITNSPSWNDVDYVCVYFVAGANNAYMLIDGLCFEGLITRAACDSGKYSSQKCRMVHIRDDVPKDDALTASDDSGQIAQFAKAELYRAVTEPIIGQIVIPMQEQIKAGQLAHIHFGKQSDGSFRIDKDMRIIQVKHKSGNAPHGFRTYLTLTDDVLNSQPMQPYDAYNRLMKAVAPGFQDRARSSIIAKDLDLNQTILEKVYST